AAQRLPLASVSDVSALDRAQTSALRGPRADPAAYLLVRPYLPCAVYVAIKGRPPERPYWLLGTTPPDGLAAAHDLGQAAAQQHAHKEGAGQHAGGSVG